jgi:hypothetical protein
VGEFPNAAALAHDILPNAKVVLSVCNPSLRLVSEYFHWMDKAPDVFRSDFVKRNATLPTGFDDFADQLLRPAEHPTCRGRTDTFCQEMRIKYLKKGHFAEHLKPWHEAYNKSNVLVINMDDDQIKIAERVMKLVGPDLPMDEYPWEELTETEQVNYKNAAYEGRSSAHEKFAETIERLEKHYFLHNKMLAEIIKENFPLEWNGETTA